MTEYTEQLRSLRDAADRRIEAIKFETTTLKEDLKEVRKAVFGNGVIGMDEMVRELYKDLKDRQEAEKEQRKVEAKADKEGKLQKIIGSWQFQIALLNGIMLVFIEIVKGLL